jgi:hypothetical protein
MNEIISLFIDDEMGLDDKIEFVEEIHRNQSLAFETIELLQLEKQIRGDVVERIPMTALAGTGILKKVSSFCMQPLGWTTVALAAAVIALFLMVVQPTGPALKQTRFVIYEPDAKRVEIAGSFTNWKRIPMRRAGASGYWELTLVLPQGEYYYSYILGGQRKLADPTVRARVPDDYGGYNSIIRVGDKT